MKKMRHLAGLLAALLSVLFLFGAAAPAMILADTTISFELPDGQTAVVPVVDDRSQRVYDYAGLYSASEKTEIASRIAKAESSKKCEIMVLATKEVPTNTSSTGKSYSRLYAEEFLKQNAEKEDAFILEIDMNNRKVVAVGHGKYGDSKYNSEMQEITDSLTGYLKNGQYAEATYSFIKSIEKIDNIVAKLIPTIPSLIISAVISGIVLLILIAIHGSSKAAVQKSLLKDEIEYTQTRHVENYLGTRREVRHIERSSDSSDSSGGGFSGGGGSFSGGESSF